VWSEEGEMMFLPKGGGELCGVSPQPKRNSQGIIDIFLMRSTTCISSCKHLECQIIYKGVILAEICKYNIKMC
jgi:hypothetical protein